MATIEKHAQLHSKDEDGNLVLLYPITRVQDVNGLQNASQSVDGLMSAQDKQRLDNIQTEGVDIKESTLKKDGVGWYFENDGSSTTPSKNIGSFFAITEDMVDVSTDDAKGVSPYDTSYGYTNITIHDDAGIEWREGNTFVFIIDTKLVVSSTYRNMKIRIGEAGTYIPIMSSGNSVISGSSYFIKNRIDYFTYSTKYSEGGALHMDTDDYVSYTYLINKVPIGAVTIDKNGFGARYSLIFATTPVNEIDERFSSLVKSSSSGTTKEAITNCTFYIDRHPQYVLSANIQAGKASAHATFQDYNEMDIRYTVNTNASFISPQKKIFLWLKDFDEESMSFKADATIGNIMSIDKISTRFPSTTTEDVYLYFLGWSGTSWNIFSPNFTQINRVFKYIPNTNSLIACNIIAG